MKKSFDLSLKKSYIYELLAQSEKGKSNSTMALHQKVKDFIDQSLGDFAKIDKLAGDASTREYFRVFSGSKTWILCLDTNFIDSPLEEYPFYIMDKLLSHNEIPVPNIYFYEGKYGLLFLEDGGDDLLQSVYPTLKPAEISSLFKTLIDIMIQIQSIENDQHPVPFGLSFDVEKLMFEFDFFIQHTILTYYQSNITKSELEKLRIEFRKISKILYHPDLFVLNHRDYHSRNILLPNHKPFIIDFQDARLGLPQYDAVSLLRDSYLILDNDVLEDLKQYHFNRLVEMDYEKMNPDEYAYFFDLMAFQRNVKALGTFGYQITSRHITLYKPYIEPTLHYLPDYIHRRKDLQVAGEILFKAIGGSW